MNVLIERAKKWAFLRLENEKILRALEAAPKPSLQLEEWSSTHNRKERHYFLQDGRSHGYQVDGAYLVGLNPEIVTREQEQAILEILRPVWE